MKKLIIFFIALLAAIWLGVIMHKNAGFVMINFGHTRVEMTLWSAILALLVLLIVGRVLVGMIRGIYRIPVRYANWSSAKNERISYRYMQEAVLSLLKNDYETAEKDFLRSVKSGKTKLLSFLGIAETAQAQQKFKQRDKYLAKAKKIASADQVRAINMIKAHWQVESKEWIPALVTLALLPLDHPFVLNMKKDIYIAQKNWEALRKMLSETKHRSIFKDSTPDDFQHEISLVLMKEALCARNHVEIEMLWKRLTRKLKHDPEILSIYAAHLVDEGKHHEAEILLTHALKDALHPSLLKVYTRVESPKPAKQLSRAEAWLASHPDNADLLFCLGKLCQKYRLWGKAKKYFRSCINRRSTWQAHQALGEVLEQLGENSAALACYREGLLKQ
ncbi:MAG: enzyme of heme biosynthesis [Gammaproteobacteria bacterium]|jgi:HemY protein|nr:enzyme of heme biosynthesis [Gammaproteobacteria bacterium]